MFRLFLSDLLGKKNIVVAFLLSAVVFGYLHFVTIPTGFWAENILLTIFIVGTTYTTFQTIHSYVIFDRFKCYIQLPISPRFCYLLLTIALFCVNFIERMFLTTLFAWKIKLSYDRIFLDYYVFSVLIIEVALLVYLGINRRQYGKLLLLVIAFMGLITIAFTFQTMTLKLAIYVIAIISGGWLLRQHRLTDILWNGARGSLCINNTSKNYFFKLFTSQRVYLVNALFVPFLIILMMRNATIANPLLLLPLLSTIGGINTPLTSMLSADHDLRQQLAMLPEKKYFLKMYFIFLWIYFSVMNSLIYLLFWVTVGRHQVFILIFGIFATFFEASFFLIIELKFPITNWKNTSDVWKHPRKYISLVALFFVNSLVFMILSSFLN